MLRGFRAYNKLIARLIRSKLLLRIRLKIKVQEKSCIKLLLRIRLKIKVQEHHTKIRKMESC